MPEKSNTTQSVQNVADTYLHKRVFQGMLRGDPSNGQEIKVIYGDRRFSNFESGRYLLHLKSQYFTVIKIRNTAKTEHYGSEAFGWSKTPEELKFDDIIHNAFEAAFGGFCDAYHVEVDRHVCILINYLKFDLDDIYEASVANTDLIKELCSTTCSAIRQSCGLDLNVSVSSVYVGCEKLPLAFREAKRLSEYQQMVGYGESTITYFDVCNNALTHDEISKKKEYEQKFLMSVMASRYTDACRYLLSMLEILRGGAYPAVASIQLQLMNFINFALGSQFLDIYTSEYDPCGVVECAKTIQLMSSLSEFIPCLKDLFQRLEQLDELQNRNGGKRVAGIMRYIQANFRNPSLNVPMICYDNDISHQYLNKLLKQYTGLGTLENIQKARLDEAKRLLSQTTLNIVQVSEKAGFCSQWTFFRSFKQAEGVTPGIYRSLTSSISEQ